MIVGERIRLRAIERADLPRLVEWRNNPEIYVHFFEHEPLSLAMQERWFETFLNRDDEKFWIACLHEQEEPLGTAALTRIDMRSRKAELGRVMIQPGEQRRQGYCREMCELVLGYAFAHLNLNRVSLEVFDDNTAAIGLYRSLGFAEEGRFRQHVFAAGRYRDVLAFSLLRAEWSDRDCG